MFTCETAIRVLILKQFQCYALGNPSNLKIQKCCKRHHSCLAEVPFTSNPVRSFLYLSAFSVCVTADLESEEPCVGEPAVIRTAEEKAGCRWLAPGAQRCFGKTPQALVFPNHAHGICAQGSPQITAV